MMDFGVSLLQLIEQGEFLWTSLSSPHLYSSECLQSTSGWRSTKPGDIKLGLDEGRRELPILFIRCAHPSVLFPGPMSHVLGSHRERFAPGTAQIGFVTSLVAVRGHPPCSPPGYGYVLAGTGTRGCVGAHFAPMAPGRSHTGSRHQVAICAARTGPARGTSCVWGEGEEASSLG